VIETINSIEDIKKVIDENMMVLAYFTTTDCNVCKDLFPKIEKMLENYPEIIGLRAEADVNRALVGAYSIFTVPSVVLFVDGKETIRRARAFSVEELESAMMRYYDMVYGHEE
jgi:thioredoxin-like negative regulator of GroEL